MVTGVSLAELGIVKTPADYLALLKRRKTLLIGTVIAVLAISVVVAYVWPPVYRSTATILIEEPEVPSDLVQSTVTSYADQRIQLIKYRILTTERLTDLMKRFDLYRELRDNTPLSDIMQKFREDVQVETISAQVLDPRNGRPTKATIAFTVAFENRTPQSAQKVANELVTLFLSENARERQGQAAATTNFLAQEADRLAAQIKDYEGRLARFKEENAGKLPEQLETNRQVFDRTAQLIDETTRRIDADKERQQFLKSELAVLATRLAQEARTAPGDPSAARLRGDIAALRATHGPNHPMVLRLQNELARLSAPVRPAPRGQGQAADGTPAQEPSVEAEIAADPLYVNLRSQLNAVNVNLASLESEKRLLAERLKKFEQRAMTTPEVERLYLSLVRDYDNARRKYNETKDKQLAAELSQSLEIERKSERFTLIEPPMLPTAPQPPTKLMLVAGGLLVAIGFGIGFVLLADVFDTRVYGARQLAALTGEMPLVVIPYFRTPGEERRFVMSNAASAAGVIALIGIGLTGIHFAVIPLDVLGLKLMAQAQGVFKMPDILTAHFRSLAR